MRGQGIGAAVSEEDYPALMLLDTDVLIVKQVTAWMRSDFAILDADGTPVGDIRTEGGLGSRFWMGVRELSVVDADGTPALQVYDEVNFGLDTFTVSRPDGSQLAHVVKEFSFFRPRLSAVLGDGTELDIRGDFFDFDYEMDAPDGRVAQVSRQWPTISEVFLDRDRYVLALGPQATPDRRLAVIGTTIILDLLRAKEQQRNRNNSFSD